jgi:lipid-A-disaccharide synthase
LKPLTFMLIAGDASGDMLGAELIAGLREHAGRDLQFFGAGGPGMQAAGLELIADFTRDGVWGLEAILRMREFRRRFQQLLHLAIQRQPDAIVCIDFAGFNRRFAHAVKERIRQSSPADWNPKIIQYVSPQVWASRPGRADKLAGDIDLLLTIFPFEKAWYAKRTPHLHVEFVGHPMIDRYRTHTATADRPLNPEAPLIVVLPGSRPGELKRHLPVLRDTLRRIREVKPGARAVMVLADRLVARAQEIGLPENVDMQSNLAEALARADLAIAKSGTITLECAFFGVPTVVFYKTWAVTWAIGKRIVQVKWVAMPNLLANEEVFPEFLQNAATAENISAAALELMADTGRRNRVQAKLREIRASLGEAGASGRAAQEILKLLGPRKIEQQ